jgi:riboflavin-specific deaminase-like protein
VTLKLALDNNGAVDDTGSDSVRFTGPASLDLVHRLRAVSDAVAVGIGTVLRDDPSLTVRRIPWTRPHPLRVVFDSSLRTPSTSALFTDKHDTLVFCRNDPARVTDGSFGPNKGVHALATVGDEGLCEAMLFLARDRGVRHLMVEGGASLARSFLAAGIVDRAILIRAPVVFEKCPVPSGIDDSTLVSAGLSPLDHYELGDDVVSCWIRRGENWPSSHVPDWP